MGAVDALSPDQRAVITLRDLVGLSATEVCDLLELTDANQRVLLHRARSRVRAALVPLVEVSR
jgi:RNA polymerase sigma-70 factor (ECF subfamily)